MLDFAALRAKLASDPHRPQLHFAAPANWMNDPNGMIQWHGRYHVFYQYNPNSALWGTIHWGHAVSSDLIHWEDLPIALTPEPDTVDADGCFSGCAVSDGNQVAMIYTGVAQHHELPCLAVSVNSDLTQLQKAANNPIIPAPPAGYDLLGFRDHCVWREQGEWRMVIGSGLRSQPGSQDGQGTVFLYASTDLQHWRLLGPLYIDDTWHLGSMWECPDFFALGDRQVLIISPDQTGKVYALIGDYHGDRFFPERVQELDGGGSFYAPQSLRDDQGRRIMIGWLREQRPDADLVAAGWAGMLSLPRALEMDPTGWLKMTPVAEWRRARGAQHDLTGQHLTAGVPLTLPTGSPSEIHLQIHSPATSIRMHITDGVERAVFALDPVTMTCAIAHIAAELATARRVPIHLGAQGMFDIRVFVDGSVVEIFVNDHVCLTQRCYPTKLAALRVELVASAPGAMLSHAAWWPLASPHAAQDPSA